MTDTASVETGTAPVPAGSEVLGDAPTRGPGAPEDLARLRVERDRALMANRTAETRLSAQQAELERRLVAFDEGLRQAELRIEALWRRQHWGLDPERPPSWRTCSATQPRPAGAAGDSEAVTAHAARRSPPRRPPARRTAAPITPL